MAKARSCNFYQLQEKFIASQITERWIERLYGEYKLREITKRLSPYYIKFNFLHWRGWRDDILADYSPHFYLTPVNCRTEVHYSRLTIKLLKLFSITH